MKASDCKTIWAKVGTIKSFHFVSKDTICFGTSCHLIFYNVVNNEQVIYTANNKKKGDGIKCFTAHRIFNIFAFAENCFNPSIFIYSYPSMTKLWTLAGDEKCPNHGYINMVFSESNFLITLGDLPKFMITVWNWRLGEKLISEPTDLLIQEQMLKCNLSSPVFLAQLGIGTNNLRIWDVLMCYKKCVLDKYIVRLSQATEYPFTSVLWTTEGGLLVLDTRGSVFTLNSEYQLERVIEFPSEGSSLTTSFVWFKAGLAISGPTGDIMHYKKSGTWSSDWTVTLPRKIFNIATAKGDFLYGITENSDIVQVIQNQNDLKYIREFESDFIDFCLIYPTGQYVVALCKSNKLANYEIATGKTVSKLNLRIGTALAIGQNPEFPYVGIGYDTGILELISVYDPNNLVTMTAFHLSHIPITHVYFNETGRIFVAANLFTGLFFILEGLPGTKMEVVTQVDINRQIVDFMLISSMTCYRLFVIPVTSKKYIAGNKLIRYCIIKNDRINIKEYGFENSDTFYHKICATRSIDRDRIFYAIPLMTRNINKIETKRGDNLARVVSTIVTGHQMRQVSLTLDKNFATTWAYDGFVIVCDSGFEERVGIALPHHRWTGGVKKAYADPSRQYIISLGEDNILVCSNLTINTPVNLESEIELLTKFKIIFTNRTIGFIPHGRLKGKSWLEVQEIRRKEKERMECEKERKSILEDFQKIQEELQELLTENLEGPNNEKLDIEEFNLDKQLYQDKTDLNRQICRKTESYLKHLISAQNDITQWLKEKFWDKMFIPGKFIRGMFKNTYVTNYPILPRDLVKEDKLKFTIEMRKIEMSYCDRNNFFQPWIPCDEAEMTSLLQKKAALPEDQQQISLFTALEELEEDQVKEAESLENKIAYAGSNMQSFIELDNYHYNQFQFRGFWQFHFQTFMSEREASKLMDYFNKEFETLMAQKVREMNTLKERNARLRHIISEFNYFSKDKVDITITDLEWTQDEIPELITKVNDKEVSITPYISPSQELMLKLKAEEEERIRLLLLADDFKERALMAMMNGVLEVRWEDELKKDVPKPKCMLDKDPEKFNEEDLRAVRDYDEKVKFLNSERERYKHLLEAEYGKIEHLIKENVRKFNERLDNLFLVKMKVESAILQENLNINKAKLTQYRRYLRDSTRRELKGVIVENEKIVNNQQVLIASSHDIVIECKNDLETFQGKEKTLEKAFKRDLQDASAIVQEQSAKLYKKRPKINVRNINSATLWNELGKSVVSHERTPTLTSDCLEYLKALDELDLFIGIPSVIDENTYKIICKHRRLRIEFEINIKAFQTDIAEAEATIALFQESLMLKKEKLAGMIDRLGELRNQGILFLRNIQIQLVLKRGLVEIPLTGELSNFDDSILICRKEVEEINKLIVKAGAKKLKAMEQMMTFRRGILSKEWEHMNMKMKIEDLKEEIKDINRVKVTKEIQAYLKAKARGFKDNSSFESEVELVKASYENLIKERMDQTMAIRKKIKAIKDNSRSVDKAIANINVDVCEFNLLKDKEIESKEKDIVQLRMTNYLKRNNLVHQIQANHNEILILETELELMKLKTYPTLKYAFSR